MWSQFLSLACETWLSQRRQAVTVPPRLCESCYSNSAKVVFIITQKLDLANVAHYGHRGLPGRNWFQFFNLDRIRISQLVTFLPCITSLPVL